MPEVRFQIVADLLALYDTAREVMWNLVEERTTNETSTAVLASLASCLGRLAQAYPDRAAELSKRIFDRSQAASGDSMHDPRTTSLATFVGLHVWRSHAPSRDVVYRLVSDAETHHRELSFILSHLRGPITHGEILAAKAEDASIRLRAVELFDAITTTACAVFANLLARVQRGALPESETEKFREIARQLNHAASEIYFASGVFEAKQNNAKEVTTEIQARFYQELVATIDRLSAIGISSIVHHLVEMLIVFVALDPRKVFLQLSALVESGKRDNYQYEGMANEHIVRIVERYLAEYRPLLQEDRECRAALREILDAFVEAGWPAAQQLSYRLDEIFR